MLKFLGFKFLFEFDSHLESNFSHLNIENQKSVWLKSKNRKQNRKRIVQNSPILNKKTLQRGFKMNYLKIRKLLSSLDRNRTCIWSFGNSYTIHCTTRPGEVKGKG